MAKTRPEFPGLFPISGWILVWETALLIHDYQSTEGEKA
jgi:hypothetical protein